MTALDVGVPFAVECAQRPQSGLAPASAAGECGRGREERARRVSVISLADPDAYQARNDHHRYSFR